MLFIGIYSLNTYNASQNIKATPSTIKATKQENKTTTTKIKLAAVGDILVHDTIYKDAKTKSGYNFKPMFKNIKKEFKNHDLIYANQESVAGGSKLGLSSYPRFNSPYQITDALNYVGVNLISLANNHSLDKGERGIVSASKYYKKFKNITTAGAQTSKKERDRIRIVNVKGVKVAFLSYAANFNGLSTPKGKSYLANKFSYTQAKKDLKKARALSDVIIVSMHWGVEYASLPNSTQIKQAKFLNKQGVDIILGAHPHVLQPAKFIKQNNHETFVIYSLGNFLSAQDTTKKLTGMILSLDINVEKSDKGTKVKINNVRGLPTYNYAKYGYKGYMIKPLSKTSKASYYKSVKKLMNKYTSRIKMVKTLQE